MEFDPVLLSRIQFAFTVSFHIIFPSFTIGLASWLAMLEWRYMRTGNVVFKETYQFWLKIFAIAFGMGVVSGIVMAYEFGTNWSGFSDAVGNVIGPLLGYEALTAFFLEATFLAIMLFGWDKVGPRLHFFSTLMVAFGTLFSSFWILSANSWMQTPAGFYLENGIAYPENWIEIIFNPSAPYRLLHMVTAAYLTTSFVVLAVGAFYFLRQRHIPQAKVMLNYALWFILIAAPLQLFSGDMHGLNALEHQPAKVAAMEANWETQGNVPLILFAIPDPEEEKNHYQLSIPNLTSLILTHHADGEVVGLKDFAKEDRPPVKWVFYCFRIMVGLGMLMILVGLLGLYFRWRGTLFTPSWFHRLCVAMGPSGFIAVISGWFVAEIGRQPWVVYNVFRTEDMASPLPGANVAISLAIFIIVYAIVFGSGVTYIFRLIKKGPQTGDTDGSHDPSAGHHPMMAADIPSPSETK